MPIQTIATLIGVDHHVDFDTLDALSDAFPIADWGVVYAGRSGGADTSEASTLDWLWRFAASAQARRWPFTLFVRGAAIDELLEAWNADGWEPGVFRVALCAERVQLNGSPGLACRVEVEALERRLRDAEFPVDLTVPCSMLGDQPLRCGYMTEQDSTFAPSADPTPSFCGLHGERVGFTIDPFAKDVSQTLLRVARQTNSSLLRTQVDARLLHTCGRFDLKRCAEALEILTHQSPTLWDSR